jgi:hypothetical protein
MDGKLIFFFYTCKLRQTKNNLKKKQQKGGGFHVLWLLDNFLVVKITLVYKKLCYYVRKNRL